LYFCIFSVKNETKFNVDNRVTPKSKTNVCSTHGLVIITHQKVQTAF